MNDQQPALGFRVFLQRDFDARGGRLGRKVGAPPTQHDAFVSAEFENFAFDFAILRREAAALEGLDFGIASAGERRMFGAIEPSFVHLLWTRRNQAADMDGLHRKIPLYFDSNR